MVRPMTLFSVEVWLALGAIGGTAVLAILYTLAAAARNDAFIHDTRIRVNRLRARYAKELEEAAEIVDEESDVIILPDPEPAPARQAA